MILSGGSDLGASDSPHNIKWFALNDEKKNFLKSSYQTRNIHYWFDRAVFTMVTAHIQIFVDSTYLHIYIRMCIYTHMLIESQNMYIFIGSPNICIFTGSKNMKFSHVCSHVFWLPMRTYIFWLPIWIFIFLLPVKIYIFGLPMKMYILWLSISICV